MKITQIKSNLFSSLSKILVMEVASGEYGEAVPTLVMALNTYKNANAMLLSENEIGIQLQGISSVSKNIANDISKSKNDKTKIRTSTSAARTKDELAYSKHSNVDHTLINLSNNDDLSSQNKVSNEVCTTSLLDSHDSVVTGLPNKHTFPTSGWKQFWILLMRAFKTILRDKHLMHMRLAAHVCQSYTVLLKSIVESVVLTSLFCFFLCVSGYCRHHHWNDLL